MSKKSTSEMSRSEEVSFLRSEIKRMLKEEGVSISSFYRTLPRIRGGSGYEYHLSPVTSMEKRLFRTQGSKPSIRQLYTICKDFIQERRSQKEAIMKIVEEERQRRLEDKEKEQKNEK